MKATLIWSLQPYHDDECIIQEFTLSSGDKTLSDIRIKGIKATAEVTGQFELAGKTYKLDERAGFEPFESNHDKIRLVNFFEGGKKISEVYTSFDGEIVFHRMVHEYCHIHDREYELFGNDKNVCQIASIYLGKTQVAEYKYSRRGIRDPHLFEITYTDDESLLASVFFALRYFIVTYFRIRPDKVYYDVWNPVWYMGNPWKEKYDPDWAAQHE